MNVGNRKSEDSKRKRFDYSDLELGNFAAVWLFFAASPFVLCYLALQYFGMRSDGLSLSYSVGSVVLGIILGRTSAISFVRRKLTWLRAMHKKWRFCLDAVLYGLHIAIAYLTNSLLSSFSLFNTEAVVCLGLTAAFSSAFFANQLKQ